ncbi:MAG: hypothetical protein C4334_06080 [Pyrinomonas sp.]
MTVAFDGRFGRERPFREEFGMFIARFVRTSLVLLLCCALVGCSNRDQTDEANKLIDEANALQDRVAEVAAQVDAKEEEIVSKDYDQERAEIELLAREQIELLKQAAALEREAIAKTERAAKMRVEDWFREYVALVGQRQQKIVAMIDVTRQRAEAIINDQSLESINERRMKLSEEFDKLDQEREELSKRIAAIEEQNKARLAGPSNANAR